MYLSFTRVTPQSHSGQRLFAKCMRSCSQIHRLKISFTRGFGSTSAAHVQMCLTPPQHTIPPSGTRPSRSRRNLSHTLVHLSKQAPRHQPKPVNFVSGSVAGEPIRIHVTPFLDRIAADPPPSGGRVSAVFVKHQCRCGVCAFGAVPEGIRQEAARPVVRRSSPKGRIRSGRSPCRWWQKPTARRCRCRRRSQNASPRPDRWPFESRADRPHHRRRPASRSGPGPRRSCARARWFVAFSSARCRPNQTGSLTNFRSSVTTQTPLLST
jgi:hypothetical protein